MKKCYVDGYVLVVRKDNVQDYKKVATEAGNSWIKHGALEYVETIGEDLESTEKFGCVSYSKLLNLTDEETAIFAYVVYNSKEHRDKVNAKIHEEWENSEDKNKPMPFDMKRMAVGGFETIVNLRREEK